MAVKYVKDFAFDSGFGFSGSSGKTPVKSHMRSPMKKADGGAVKSKGFDNSTRNPISKFPDIAPAMVGKRSKGLGGLTSETKKLAAYDKPHAEGKKGAKVAQYAKGGAVKKAHAKKPMPPFLKAKMMKKAEGGPVAEITEGDGMSPLQEMAYALPYDYMKDIVVERELPPPPEFNEEGMRVGPDRGGSRMYDPTRDAILEQTPPPLDYERMDDAHTRMTEMNQELMRMMNAQRNATAPREDVGQPVGVLSPLPEEPNYDLEAGMRKGLASGLPPRMSPIEPSGSGGGGGGGGSSDVGIGGLFGNVPVKRPGGPIPGQGQFGPLAGNGLVKRPGGPIPGQGQFGPLAGDDGMMYAGGGDSIRGSSHYRLNPSAPSPLARAAMPTKADRMATRRDNMMAARDIMDRYVGGERSAMPRRSMAPGMRGMAEGKARRAMPVAPRAPMIDRSEPQPYMRNQMPNLNPRSAEEIAEYSKGRTFSPEGRFAKGGRVSKGEKKIGKVMGEFKRGELHSGSKKGPVVTNPKQAKAIALSEARAAGAKVPKKRAMGGRACG